jgi:hypothetical protein
MAHAVGIIFGLFALLAKNAYCVHHVCQPVCPQLDSHGAGFCEI